MPSSHVLFSSFSGCAVIDVASPPARPWRCHFRSCRCLDDAHGRLGDAAFDELSTCSCRAASSSPHPKFAQDKWRTGHRSLSFVRGKAISFFGNFCIAVIEPGSLSLDAFSSIRLSVQVGPFLSNVRHWLSTSVS